MTIATDLPPATTGSGDRGIGPGRHGLDRWVSRVLDPIEGSGRTWAIHLVLLALVLVAGLVWMAPRQVVSADEGAALIQAQVLSDTGGWTLPATDEIDVDGRWFPFDATSRVDGQIFSFTRPPTYPLMIRSLFDVGGLPGAIAPQLAAVWVAAAMAGLLADRLRAGRGIQAMWLTGVLSPLLFDGYWLIAHSIAAAGAAAAVLGAVRVVVDGRSRWLPVWLVGLISALAVRTESVLLAASMAVVLVGIAVVGRHGRRLAALALGGGTLALAAAANWSLSAWRASIEGGPSTLPGSGEPSSGFVAGRIKGFSNSVLGAGMLADVGALLVIVAAVAIVGAVVCTRFELSSPRGRRCLAAVAVTCSAARLLLPVDLVTGLLMAAPFIVAAALCVPRSRLADRATLVVAGTAGLTTLAVLATQHERGGTGEWGGRYFHVVLPLVCVLAVVSCDWMLEHRGATARVVVVAGLVTSSALGVLSMRESAAVREVADIRTELTWSAATGLRSADDPDGPVIVSSWRAGGRFAWRHMLHGRYYLVEDDADLAELGRRLAFAGVPDFVFLAQPDDRRRLGHIGSGYRVTHTSPMGTNGWAVVVLERS